MQTKKNLTSILTITLLIFTVGILFWYGDKKIKQASDINSTVIAWENLSNSYPLCKGNQNSRNDNFEGFLCNNKNLNLTIHNITPKSNTYKIKWLLSDKIIDSQEIKINRQKEIISPTEKVLSEIVALSKDDKKEILYQVEISWGKNKMETIGKWLAISPNQK